MDEVISCCGLICKTCPIYLATREKNDKKRHEMRAEIAQQIKKHYGKECKPEDVGDCDGCKAETGRLFCSECKIRICAVQKGIENCAYCNDYPCQKLKELFATDPEASKRLDGIRSRL